MHTLEPALEIERLALVALELTQAKAPANDAELEKAFLEALPRAFHLLELTQQFLDKKEQEKAAYWDTPEGKKEFAARKAEVLAWYDKRRDGE